MNNSSYTLRVRFCGEKTKGHVMQLTVKLNHMIYNAEASDFNNSVRAAIMAFTNVYSGSDNPNNDLKVYENHREGLLYEVEYHEEKKKHTLYYPDMMYFIEPRGHLDWYYKEGPKEVVTLETD